MCGIAGWIATPEPGAAPDAMERMLAAMAHRGPDGQGIYRAQGPGDHQVCLGHRRLAIIDPEGGHQPMLDPEAHLALVFNGEIYNFRELRQELSSHGYRFQLDSDTEVLLRAYQHWGTGLLEHLRGMFAFALWDGLRQRLFLARDRFGEKPLFLCETKGNLYFASEIKALECLPACRQPVALDAVWDYLAYRYVPGPRTLHQGIRKLPPGHALCWEQGRQKEWRYWSPPDRQTRHARGERPEAADTVQEFLARLDESVHLQMVSDVPFGAFLSGGLDSSMIVGLMTRHCSQVNTFSVGFQGDDTSELPFAALVAGAFGTRHQEIRVSPRDVVDTLPQLIAYRDAPVSEPSDVAIHRMAKEASRSVKMVLTGEGSDEILGGYPKHVYERFAPGYQRLPGLVRHRLVAPLVRALPYGFRRAKTALNTLDIEDDRERYARWFGAMNHRERASLSRLAPCSPARADAPPFDTDAGNSALRRILYFDQSSWLPDNLLERGDRMSMAASIEARVPFLDHQLAEYVSTLPDQCRVRGMTTKWLLREAGRQVIPESILKRPKVGFRVPVHRWFREDLRDFLLDHLQGSDSRTRAYYDPVVLDGLLAEHMEGRQNHEKLLWSLLNLEIWHRQHARA